MGATAEYGVFGGSGFYSLLASVERVEIDTPYGQPSDPVAVGEIGGRRVAFLPRHGGDHRFPPHTVPYRANVWAMKELGVKRLFGPCAAGSLQPKVKRGDFVVCDQLVDRTSGRTQTFYDGLGPTHISFADPYCPAMREALVAGARANDIEVHDRGTVVVVEAIANEIGIAIDNAQLMAESHLNEHEAITLSQVGMQVSASLALRLVRSWL